jgi:multiple sugar transport system ATP-binding protein
MGQIELREIKKSFGAVPVIQSVDLTINAGEFVVFVGPSGCGKSTMLRLIAGLEEVSSGQVLIEGQDVTRKGADRRGLAMVFQSYALYPHMTVRENMAFSLDIAGLDRKTQAGRVQTAAEVLQLHQLLERKPRELSGGQRQRVAIGRAIVREPAAFSCSTSPCRISTRLCARKCGWSCHACISALARP